MLRGCKKTVLDMYVDAIYLLKMYLCTCWMPHRNKQRDGGGWGTEILPKNDFYA